MRHGKKFNHLGRTASHRSAMLSNMASSLILYKRINTTLAKAKALRKYVEPLITKAKLDTTHSRRVVFSYLQNKDSVHELFGSVAEKVISRPGGYTRIIKTGTRLGDNAEMCMMELVDFNEMLLEDSESSKAKTRRSRRGSKKKSTEVTATASVETETEDVVVEEDKGSNDVEASIVEEEVTEEAEDVQSEDTNSDVESNKSDEDEVDEKSKKEDE